MLLRCSAESSRLSTTPRSIPSAAELQSHQDHRAIGPKRAAEAGTGLTGPQHLGSAPSMLPVAPATAWPPAPSAAPGGHHHPTARWQELQACGEAGEPNSAHHFHIHLQDRALGFNGEQQVEDPGISLCNTEDLMWLEAGSFPLSSADQGTLTHISPPASSCKWEATSHCTLPLNILFRCPEKKKSRKIILGISCLWHMIINSSPHQNIPTSGAFTRCNLEKAICIVQNAFVRFPFCYISIAVSVLAVDLIYHS